MKKDAKIGLSIILGAVLLSALLIGKALQSRDHKPVKIPGDSGSQEGAGEAFASKELSSSSLTPDEGDGDGDTSLSQLTGESPDSGAAPDSTPAGEGSPSASPGAGTGGSETFGHSGALPEGGTSESGGSSSEGSSAGVGGSAASEGATEAGGAGGANETAGVTGAAAGPVGGWASPGGETSSSGSEGATAGSGAATGYESAGVTPAAGSDFSYSVQEGDSAWKISKRLLGSGVHWKKIVKANPKVSFSNLKVGTKLIIPGKVRSAAAASSSPAVATTTVEPAAGARLHKVVSGDSLYKIAKKYLGSGMRYREIAKLNPNVNPSALRLGQQLKIPAR